MRGYPLKRTTKGQTESMRPCFPFCLCSRMTSQSCILCSKSRRLSEESGASFDPAGHVETSCSEVSSRLADKGTEGAIYAGNLVSSAKRWVGYTLVHLQAGSRKRSRRHQYPPLVTRILDPAVRIEKNIDSSATTEPSCTSLSKRPRPWWLSSPFLALWRFPSVMDPIVWQGGPNVPR
jgi:hypothetical protein